MKTLIALVALAGILKYGDAQIAWTEPSGGTGTETIAESQATGETIQTFEATPTATKTIGDYTLLTTGTPFAVSTGGVLTLTTAVDFETLATYTIEVKVVDTNPSSSTATITINVTDANDAPVCVQDQYVATVSDGSTAGKAVITVSATDQDSANTLTWSVTGSDFSIGPSTGALTVAADKTLDASTTGGYQLTATVSDGTVTDTCTVWVAVTDCSSGSATVFTSVFTVFVAFLASLN